jgi:hypothetical protein
MSVSDWSLRVPQLTRYYVTSITGMNTIDYRFAFHVHHIFSAIHIDDDPFLSNSKMTESRGSSGVGTLSAAGLAIHIDISFRGENGIRTEKNMSHNLELCSCSRPRQKQWTFT